MGGELVSDQRELALGNWSACTDETNGATDLATGMVVPLTHPSVLNTPAAPEHAVDLMADWFRSPSVTPLNGVS